MNGVSLIASAASLHPFIERMLCKAFLSDLVSRALAAAVGARGG